MNSSLWIELPALLCLGCHRKIPQTGDLNNRNLFSHTSGGWAVPSESAGCFGSQVRAFVLVFRQLSSGCVLTDHHTERQSKLSGISLIKIIIHHEGPFSGPHLNLITFQGPKSQHHHIVGYVFNLWIWGDAIQSKTWICPRTVVLPEHSECPGSLQNWWNPWVFFPLVGRNTLTVPCACTHVHTGGHNIRTQLPGTPPTRLSMSMVLSWSKKPGSGTMLL